MESKHLIIVSIGGIIGFVMALMEKFLFGSLQTFSYLEWILLGLVAGFLIVALANKKW